MVNLMTPSLIFKGVEVKSFSQLRNDLYDEDVFLISSGPARANNVSASASSTRRSAVRSSSRNRSRSVKFFYVFINIVSYFDTTKIVERGLVINPI